MNNTNGSSGVSWTDKENKYDSKGPITPTESLGRATLMGANRLHLYWVGTR